MFSDLLSTEKEENRHIGQVNHPCESKTVKPRVVSFPHHFLIFPEFPGSNLNTRRMQYITSSGSYLINRLYLQN